jgi:hypothetical protein
MRSWLWGLAASLLAFNAMAIEFKPHPTARINESQWTSYFEQVRAAHGNSAQTFADLNLIVFHDDVTVTSYAFTQPGHPAHPAWVTRRIVKAGDQLNVNQIGYFAGQEAPFAQLYRQYEQLNQRMIEEMKRQPSPK